MRKGTSVFVAALATVVATAVVAAPAHAKPPKPRAELVVKGLAASYAAGQVSVNASVKNNGNVKARKSRTEFLLSTDGKKSADDASLETVATSKLKPKAKRSVTGSAALPAGLQPGVYRLIACVDVTGVVKERKEQNNCRASTTSVTLPGGPPAPGKVTVAATATTGGTVVVSGVSGGSCTGTFCTLTSGAGAVTFTPTAAAGHRFGGWSGCTGYTGTTAITFTNPTASQACTATFVKQVMVSWSIHAPLTGTVAGVATNGMCTAANPVTGAGDCFVDAGVGTVTLTATAVLPFTGWSGATCDGVASGTGGVVMTLSISGADKACTATFTI